jgi:hypothetical protein
MWKRFLWIFWLALLPAVLVGCPGDDDSIGEEIDEAIEEIEDEIDDAF